MNVELDATKGCLLRGVLSIVYSNAAHSLLSSAISCRVPARVLIFHRKESNILSRYFRYKIADWVNESGTER